MGRVIPYLYCPCRECVVEMSNSEKSQYGTTWNPDGMCPRCGLLYCGNPQCNRVLREAGREAYVIPVAQEDGTAVMICEHCGTEHQYAGGNTPHLSCWRPPGGGRWRAA
jgi:hypothetical protein